MTNQFSPLKILAAGATVLAMVLISPSANAQAITWNTQTLNNASASVAANSDVSLRVFQTSWASAVGDLGSLDGSLTISFNWGIRDDGWWEVPGVSLDTAGASPFQIPACRPITDMQGCGNVIASAAGTGALTQFPMPVGGSTTGTYSNTFSVQGQTNLVFFLVPSFYSSNGDHANTYFNITNLDLNYVAAVPEPETYAMMLAGLGLLGFMRRQKQQTA